MNILSVLLLIPLVVYISNTLVTATTTAADAALQSHIPLYIPSTAMLLCYCSFFLKQDTLSQCSADVHAARRPTLG
jgi:hypothetical protein